MKQKSDLLKKTMRNKNFTQVGGRECQLQKVSIGFESMLCVTSILPSFDVSKPLHDDAILLNQ